MESISKPASTPIPAPTTAIMSLLAIGPIVVRNAFHPRSGVRPRGAVDGYLPAGSCAGASGAPGLDCFLLGVQKLETLADLQFLCAGVVLQAVDVFFLTLDLFGEAVVALFHILDLALLVLPGVHTLREGEEGIAHRHQENNDVNESGQRRFHATIVPGT